MDSFDFKYNFDHLDLLSLRDSYGITREEIISVYENYDSSLREVYGEDPDVPIFISIGDSLKGRIMMIAFVYPEFTVDFIGALPPSQKDIDNYYC